MSIVSMLVMCICVFATDLSDNETISVNQVGKFSESIYITGV